MNARRHKLPGAITVRAVATAILAAPAAGDGVRMTSSFLTIPANPIDIHAIDTDDDGRDEVVLFYQSPPRGIVLRADETARLHLGDTIPLGPFVIEQVRTADVNGDGRTDIVTYSRTGGVYQIMLNQGNGTFIPSPDSPLPSTVTSRFSLADTNSDGLPEIIALTPPYIAIYRNLGGGRFAVPVLSQHIDNGRREIASASVSMSGAPAIGVLGNLVLDIYHPADHTGLNYSLFQTVPLPFRGAMLRAAGTNESEGFLMAATDSAAIIAVHFDADSNAYHAAVSPDTSISQTNTGFALSRNPDKPLRTAFSFSSNGTPRVLTRSPSENGFQQTAHLTGLFGPLNHATFADLLGDGNEHLVYASFNRALSLSPGADSDFRAAGFYQPVPNSPAQLIPFPARPRTYLAGPHGLFQMHLLEIESTPQGPRAIMEPIPNVSGSGGIHARWAVIDINGDGLDDLAHLTNYYADGRIRWHIQQPDGSFSNFQEIIVTSGTITNLVAADLNQDGYGDLAILFPNGSVRIMYGNANGQISSPVAVPLSIVPGSGSLLIADLDNDGLLDLICTNRLGSASSAFRVAYAQTTTSYRPPVSFPAPPGSGSLTGGQIDAADLNGDGTLDIAILNEHGAHIMLSNGPRSYFPPIHLINRTNAIDIRLVDLNKNGQHEVLATFRESSVIVSKDDDGNFTKFGEFAHVVNPFTATAVDLDDDSLPDILHTASSSVSIVYNRSPQPCLADYLPDGVLDFFDVARFISDFNNQVPSTDLNGDGLFNFFDFAAFILAFSTGCP